MHRQRTASLLTVLAVTIGTSLFLLTSKKYEYDEAAYASLLTRQLSPVSTDPEFKARAAGQAISFYVKTSGKKRYLGRAERIADTWGKDADSITFLFDNDDKEAVDEFGRERPWAKIKHVEGTERFGEYKTTGGDSGAAHTAQRLKTRAVFASEFRDHDDAVTPEPPEEKGQQQQPDADWVCYLDDDMLVNVANLKEDLLEKEPSCAPNCLIGDEWGHGGDKFTAGGWCMQRPLAARVSELLKDHTDKELRWTSTDDVSFNSRVIRDKLGVSPTDSERWCSELIMRKRHKSYKFPKVPGKTYWETAVPNLAVYHIRFLWSDDAAEFSFV